MEYNKVAAILEQDVSCQREIALIDEEEFEHIDNDFQQFNFDNNNVNA